MKEPFVRIIKRDGATMRLKILVRIAAILLALVVDAVFIYGVTGLNPLDVYEMCIRDRVWAAGRSAICSASTRGSAEAMKES